MDNHEEILDALTAFGKSPNPQEIPSILEQYLNCVAKNGETLFPWTQLKPLILRKMELVILELRRCLASENIPTRPNVENVRFDVIHARIIDALHKFNGAPFTIQRLCELLIDPKRHYKRSDKFMRGLEKNVLVVSTVDPFGRKVVCESGNNKPMMNGILDINGSTYPSRDSGLSVPLPPVPGWVNTPPPSSPTRAVLSVSPSEAKEEGSESSVEGLGKDGEVVSNGVSGGMAVSSSVFSHQGDPLAVQSEEVIEETVVTMDTSDVSAVVTDGGEAMADGDGLEGDNMAEDREASSFSSSSSSSEEFSTSSDSIETGIKVTTFEMTANNSICETTLDENRPWAAFAQDTKQDHEAMLHSSVSQTAETKTSSTSPPSSDSPQIASSVSSSSPSLSSVSETTLSQSVTAPLNAKEEQTESRIPAMSEASESNSDAMSWVVSEGSGSAASADQSFGFEPEVSGSTSDCNIALSTSSTELKDQDRPTPSTTAITTSCSISYMSDPSPSSTSTSSSSLPSTLSATASTPTYAQVVASSSTDNNIMDLATPYGSEEETGVPCDSVAGLERLVGSMEQSFASTTSSTAISSTSPMTCLAVSSSSLTLSHTHSASSSSSPSPSSLPTSSAYTVSEQSFPSSTQCTSSLLDEPVSKRRRLSKDEVDTESAMEEECISTSGDVASVSEDKELTGISELENHTSSDNDSMVHSSSVLGKDLMAMEKDGNTDIEASVTGSQGMEDSCTSSGSDNLSQQNSNDVSESNAVKGSLDECKEEGAVYVDESAVVSKVEESSDVSIKMEESQQLSVDSGELPGNDANV